ncbi:hypothetical protein [Scytonema sp. NUACC26]|uniref:hypothetical protein n=1 Tax=Scytonema sp. NUACC26 TaxID=3140176 RepID=UPI0034DCB725
MKLNDSFSGLTKYKLEKHTKNWKNLHQEQLEKLPVKDLASIKQLIEKQGQSEFASLRIADLAQIAQRPTSPTTKLVVKVIATIFSAITFSAGTQVLTARLGKISLPSALFAAAIAGYLVEDRGTKTITRLRQRQSTLETRQALERYIQENPPSNELEDKFIRSEFSLLQTIESGNFTKHFPVDSTLAGGLTLAEYVVAFWIVAQLGLPGGLLIEGIAASIPIAILWIGAAFQSETFELPERHLELIKKYQPYVFQSESLSEEEVKEIYCLDRCLQFVLQGDSTGQIKNLGMARAEFDICYYRKRKQQFEQERLQILEELQNQHHEAITQLPNLFPKQTGLSREEYTWEQTKWVEQQTRKLEAVLIREIEMIRQKYSQKINHCEEEILNAQQTSQAAYLNWKSDRNCLKAGS